MSSIKVIIAVGLVALVAACAQQEEEVMVEPMAVEMDDKPMSKM